MGPARPAPRVVVAGGGPAAIEAVLALRESLPSASVLLVAPDEEFVYRPEAVLEPFGGPPPHRFRLADIASFMGVDLWRDAVTGFDADGREVLLGSGRRAGFDALVVAIGARQIDSLPGSTTFWGRDGDPALVRLLERLRADPADVVFAVPPGVAWTLPIYELALGAAAWRREHELDLELTVVTPEPHPLSIFGGSASAGVEGMLDDAGVRLHTSTDPSEYCQLDPAASPQAAAEAVIALPRLIGRRIPGLPANDNGFLPVDDRGRVDAAAGVYAAGDVIDFPIKQGGLGAQQADAAVTALVADLTGEPEADLGDTVLRARLLAPGDPRYVRRELGIGGAASITGSPVWWPGAKLFGRYLSPFLVKLESLAGPGALEPAS